MTKLRILEYSRNLFLLFFFEVQNWDCQIGQRQLLEKNKYYIRNFVTHQITFLMTCQQHKIISIFLVYFIEEYIFRSTFFIIDFLDNFIFFKSFIFENDAQFLTIGHYITLSHQLTKYNNFLLECWFLTKNLSNVISLIWKLDNPYYHKCKLTYAVSICAWFVKCQFGSLLQTQKKIEFETN